MDVRPGSTDVCGYARFLNVLAQSPFLQSRANSRCTNRAAAEHPQMRGISASATGHHDLLREDEVADFLAVVPRLDDAELDDFFAAGRGRLGDDSLEDDFFAAGRGRLGDDSLEDDFFAAGRGRLGDDSLEDDFFAAGRGRLGDVAVGDGVLRPAGEALRRRRGDRAPGSSGFSSRDAFCSSDWSVGSSGSWPSCSSGWSVGSSGSWPSCSSDWSVGSSGSWPSCSSDWSVGSSGSWPSWPSDWSVGSSGSWPSWPSDSSVGCSASRSSSASSARDLPACPPGAPIRMFWLRSAKLSLRVPMREATTDVAAVLPASKSLPPTSLVNPPTTVPPDSWDSCSSASGRRAS